VFNTYNYAKASPRFRVVIPFDKAISTADYIVLYDNVIAKIVESGYGVGKSKSSKRSGLDTSKKSPTSLFYLPCQAINPSDSFFWDYKDNGRKTLDPTKWTTNTVVHFPRVDARRETPPPLTREVDQSAIDEATRAWRESPQHPGEGNARFFNYALSLRSAGMPLADIEVKLPQEANLGDQRKNLRPRYRA
jgi:hypothetical protein